jgi:hypothetical protein
MIKHLLVYGCEDKYSHEPIKCMYQKTALTPERRQEILDHYRLLLKGGGITVLHIVELEVDSDAGSLNVVFNEFGKVEPRKRIVINPDAVKAKPSVIIFNATTGASNAVVEWAADL